MIFTQLNRNMTIQINNLNGNVNIYNNEREQSPLNDAAVQPNDTAKPSNDARTKKLFMTDGIEDMQRTEEEKKAALRTGVIGGLCCGVVIYFANCLQQIGIVTTSAGKAAFITALYVILVPIVGIFLKHKTGIKVWIGAVLAVIGLYLLCITGGDFHLAPGDLIILICAFFWAFHVLVMDHFAPKANVALIVCVQSFTAGAIGFAVAFTRETFAWSDVAGALPSLLYVAIFCSAVAYTLQGVGQRDADPTVASIVMSLESVFAVISGFLLLHETLSSRELLGCVIMLIAIIIPQLPDKKSKTESAAA